MVNKPRLAIITTHPIQYNAPLFGLLAQRQKIEIKVFYTWGQSKEAIYDPGFGHHRHWDIPLLEGYDFCFIENRAKRPGSHHFNGIVTPGLIKHIADWGATAILVYGWSFRSHLACMRHFKNKLPVFFRGDSTLLDNGPFYKEWARRFFLRWVYRSIDKAFYTGIHNKAYLQDCGLSTSQLVYAPHAVDNDRFSSITKAQEKNLAQWREAIGISKDDFVVLFVGKFEEKKHPQFLLQLARKITAPTIKFLLVGNGPLEEVLKNGADSNKVLFLPFQNQSKMPLVYRLGSALILPSKGPGETWGLAANEAMAAGLPVILSSRTGGAPDLVGDKGPGLVFSVQDLDTVAGYICQLHRDRELYKATAEKARAHIREFNFEKIASAIETEMQKRTIQEACGT